MVIIKATEKHLQSIMSLCKDCSQNMMNNSIDQWDDIYPNREIFLNDITDNSLYLAVSDKQEILACIVLNEHQDPEYGEIRWKYNEDKSAILHRLMVHPKYEGKGIAKELVKYVERLAKENHYRSIRLDVFSKNLRAVSFYKKLGYEVAGEFQLRKGRFFCCEKLL